jgi:ubiquinone/menaquinone biosynthesis C-methylase UbiE
MSIVISGMRSGLRRLVSEDALETLRRLEHLHKEIRRPRTRRLFDAAGTVPPYLDAGELDRLQHAYPALPDYGYDPDSLKLRGSKRAAQVLALPGVARAARFLEVGCWDGMVSCMLQRSGKSVTAIDRSSEGFDERASAAGVALLQMDAESLQIEDETFDVVFSYDTFEHVARPDRVLAECIRVTRKGGLIYLNFGPLFMSAFGEHAYRSIAVPYCQHLFPLTVLNDYAIGHRLESIEEGNINRWTLRDYRALWKKFVDAVAVERYRESLEISHLDLIRKHPSCFKSKSDCFEEFIISGIRILLRKIA